MSSFIKTFSSGIGLRILISFIPPVSIAWIFFILHLKYLYQFHHESFWSTLGLGLAGIAIGSVVVTWLILSVAPPLQSIASLTNRLKEGESDFVIPHRHRRDEIGSLANALETFRQMTITKNKLEAEQASIRAQAERQRKLINQEMAESFTEVFKNILSGLNRAITTQEASAQKLSAAVQVATNSVESISATVKASNENMATISAATRDLAESSRHIGQQTSQSHTIAETAAEGVRKASENAIKLDESAQKIGDVVALIGNIADQTNLLALNATIEAARAGEVGKGFAVVAGEVKSLANQTTQATGEITGQITEIQEAINLVVSNISMIVETINTMREISQTISDAAGHQMVATNKIVDVVNITAASTSEAQKDMSKLGETTQKVDATSKDVLSATLSSQKECAHIQEEVRLFAERVRNA